MSVAGLYLRLAEKSFGVEKCFIEAWLLLTLRGFVSLHREGTACCIYGNSFCPIKLAFASRTRRLLSMRDLRPLPNVAQAIRCINVIDRAQCHHD